MFGGEDIVHSGYNVRKFNENATEDAVSFGWRCVAYKSRYVISLVG